MFRICVGVCMCMSDVVRTRLCCPRERHMEKAGRGSGQPGEIMLCVSTQHDPIYTPYDQRAMIDLVRTGNFLNKQLLVQSSG